MSEAGARPFESMTALLLGATSGIGLAAAEQLAAAGVRRVVICGRDAARGQAAVRRVRARARDAEVVHVAADASSREGVARAVDAALERGGIDVLVNAVPGDSAPAPFERFDPERIPALLRLHLESVFRATHAALPSMIGRGGGTIVNVASDAAKIPTPGEAVHGALMAAIAMFSRTLALEQARHRIRVHALTPSIVSDTISYERMMADPFSARLFQKAIDRAALGVPTPDDVAAAIVFLCSPAAARCTGQTLTINGGIAIA